MADDPRSLNADVRLLASEWQRLLALVSLAAAAYAAAALLRHWHFGSSGFDLGIQDQAMWQMSRFTWPFSSFQDIPFAADHFDPILLVVVPLYWLWPRPEALLLAQSVVLASAAIPVYLFVRRRLTSPLALVFAAAYLLFWGTQRTALFQFHELSFAAPIVAWAVLAMERRQWRRFALWMGLLLLVKEDQPLVVIGFGGLLLVRGDRRAGVWTAAAGLAALAAMLLWILPALAGGEPWQDAYRFSYLVDARAFVSNLLGHPQRLELLLMYFAPWLFLPLASPLVVAGVPLMLSRLLSDTPQHWMAAFHYTAPLSPLLAMAAADGWARLRTRSSAWSGPKTTRVVATTLLLICALQPGTQSVLRLLWPPMYQFATWEQRLPDVRALVPAGASLVVQDALAPHFSQRDRIYTLDTHERDADFVMACTHADPWPNASFDAVARLLDRYRGTHTTIYEQDGWIVMARKATPR